MEQRFGFASWPPEVNATSWLSPSKWETCSGNGLYCSPWVIIEIIFLVVVSFLFKAFFRTFLVLRGSPRLASNQPNGVPRYWFSWLESALVLVSLGTLWSSVFLFFFPLSTCSLLQCDDVCIDTSGLWRSLFCRRVLLRSALWPRFRAPPIVSNISRVRPSIITDYFCPAWLGVAHNAHISQVMLQLLMQLNC